MARVQAAIASSPAPLAQVSQPSASAGGTNADVRKAANDRARQELRQEWIGSPLGLRAFNKSGGHEGAKAIRVLALKRSSPAC